LPFELQYFNILVINNYGGVDSLSFKLHPDSSFSIVLRRWNYRDYRDERWRTAF